MNEIDTVPVRRWHVLVVGTGDPLGRGLKQALLARGFRVSEGSVLTMVDKVLGAAPDLVLLAGDASEDGGDLAATALAEQPVTAIMPVVLLADTPRRSDLMSVSRHGLVAIVGRDSGPDGVAEQLQRVADELPDRTGELRGVIGRKSLADLVSMMEGEQRAGVLTVQPETDLDDAHRIAVSLSDPPSIEAGMARVEPWNASDDLVYEYHETPSVRLGSVAPGAMPETGVTELPRLTGINILLIDGDPGRADGFAQALRSCEATVAVWDGQVEGMGRFSGHDYDCALVGTDRIQGQGYDAIYALRRDLRLRWISLALLDWDALWPVGTAEPDVRSCAARLLALLEPVRELREQAQVHSSFETRLEVLGPGRTLRALAGARYPMQVRVNHRRGRVEVTMDRGTVVGAWGQVQEGGPCEGLGALALLETFCSGHVAVERQLDLGPANLGMPVERALTEAVRHAPDVKSALPPARMDAGGTSVELPRDPMPRSRSVPPVLSLGADSSDNDGTRPSVEPVPPRSFAQSSMPAPDVEVGSTAPHDTLPQLSAPDADSLLAPSDTEPSAPHPFGGLPASEPPGVAAAGTLDELVARVATEVGDFESSGEGPGTIPVVASDLSLMTPAAPIEELAKLVSGRVQSSGQWLLGGADPEEVESAPSLVSEQTLQDQASLAPVRDSELVDAGPDGSAAGQDEQALAAPPPLSMPDLSPLAETMNFAAESEPMPQFPVEVAEVAPPALHKSTGTAGGAASPNPLPVAEKPLDQVVRWVFRGSVVTFTVAFGYWLASLMGWAGQSTSVHVGRVWVEPPPVLPDPVATRLAEQQGVEIVAPGALPVGAPVRVSPKDRSAAESLIDQGVWNLRKGTPEAAEALFKLAVERDPSSSRAVASLSRYYMERGEPEEAAVWAERAVQMRPRRLRFHLLLGDALAATGRTEAARAAWLQARALRPRDPRVVARLAGEQR